MLANDRFRRLALGFAAASLTAGLLLMSAHAHGGAARPKQTLTGAAARNSPQADVYIAYEQALLDGGLEAADKYMSPAQREEIKAELKDYGIEAFKQIQAEKRKARVSPAKMRERIQRVEITGDYAYLEALTDRKGILDAQAYLRTAEGWKVTPVRREDLRRHLAPDSSGGGIQRPAQ